MLPENVQKEIDSISKQIAEKYKPQKIVLFGSAVWGNFTPDSDLDFLIIKKETPYLGRDRARELRKLISKKIAADFLVYRPEEIQEREKMGDSFVVKVLSRGKVLYEGE